MEVPDHGPVAGSGADTAAEIGEDSRNLAAVEWRDSPVSRARPVSAWIDALRFRQDVELGVAWEGNSTSPIRWRVDDLDLPSICKFRWFPLEGQRDRIARRVVAGVTATGWEPVTILFLTRFVVVADTR